VNKGRGDVDIGDGMFGLGFYDYDVRGECVRQTKSKQEPTTNPGESIVSHVCALNHWGLILHLFGVPS